MGRKGLSEHKGKERGEGTLPTRSRYDEGQIQSQENAQPSLAGEAHLSCRGFYAVSIVLISDATLMKRLEIQG